MAKETITIDMVTYQNMLRQIDWLSCLKHAGVDNWEGISYAYELYEEMYPYDEQ